MIHDNGPRILRRVPTTVTAMGTAAHLEIGTVIVIVPGNFPADHTRMIGTHGVSAFVSV